MDGGPGLRSQCNSTRNSHSHGHSVLHQIQPPPTEWTRRGQSAHPHVHDCNVKKRESDTRQTRPERRTAKTGLEKERERQEKPERGGGKQKAGEEREVGGRGTGRKEREVGGRGTGRREREVGGRGIGRKEREGIKWQKLEARAKRLPQRPKRPAPSSPQPSRSQQQFCTSPGSPAASCPATNT
eukprot:364293-Chlamydomonas_euryale.AAC.6